MIDGISPDMSRIMEDALGRAESIDVLPNEGTSPSFQDLFSRLIQDVDEAQKNADVSIQHLASGEPGTSIQDVVLKLEEADITFRLMKEIRDKLLSAYQEIVNMQV